MVSFYKRIAKLKRIRIIRRGVYKELVYAVIYLLALFAFTESDNKGQGEVESRKKIRSTNCELALTYKYYTFILTAQRSVRRRRIKNIKSGSSSTDPSPHTLRYGDENTTNRTPITNRELVNMFRSPRIKRYVSCSWSSYR